VNVSEVDAVTTSLPGDEAARWHAQRVAFQQVVSACVAVSGCEAVTFWGFSDEYSWLNENSAQDALLFDRSDQPKPAYVGVMHGFAGRSPRLGANLVRNADFSAGQEEWSASAGQLTVAPAEGLAGNAACVSGRAVEADGLVQEDLLAALGTGGPHTFSAMVRASAASTVTAAFSISESGEEDVAQSIAFIDVDAGVWTLLNGDLGVGFEGAPDALRLTLSGPDAGVELCVADVALSPLIVD
jgi:hypothetical protein